MTQKGQKVQLHPLVIMQMSEHYSRFKVQQGKNVKEVYGAILGRQNNRQVEAINSFQVKIEYDENGVMAQTLCEGHIEQRAEQYLEVFPELQVIGMYCCGETDGMQGSEKEILMKMAFKLRGPDKATHIDTPLLLKMNAATAGESRTLPLTAHEIDMVDPDRVTQVEWILVSEESERIGVNHIAKLSTKDGVVDGAANEKHAKAQTAALKMLANRVELILAYFDKVQDGSIVPDHDILKEANLLAQRLKTIDRYVEEMGDDFVKEEKNVAVFQLLPQITKLIGNMAHVWAKVSGNRNESAINDESYNMRMHAPPRWGLTRRNASGVRNFEEDEFLDDDDDQENGGLKRKINADSQFQPVPSARAATRKERKGRRQEKFPRALASSSNNPSTSNNQSMIDQEMEATAWGPEEVRVGPAGPSVPDAPMPSASDSASTIDEHLDEPI